MDTKRYARFTRPGHAVTGDRTTNSAEKREQVGYEYAHAIIDDHTRLAYSELHPDERAGTVVAFTQRALAWYAGHGITPKRVMTDNAWTYTRSPRLNALLADNDVAHLTISPRRPQTNGKIERFHQTMAREWAYGLSYLSSTHRAEALPHWLDHYNEHRPHSALGNRPPISRVRNVSRQDI
jgi:transposase InsO family protein